MKRVLIIRLTAMGDVAMTSPVVSAACRKYKDVQFDVLSEPFFEPFFETHENLHFIGTNIRKSGEGVRGLWKLYRKLAQNHYDVVIDLHNVLRTKILRTFMHRLSGIDTFVVDKGRQEKRQLTEDNGKDKKQLKHTILRYCDVFAKAGLPVELDGTYRDKESSSLVNRDNNELLIGVSPFAQHMGKIYPTDKMKTVVELLAEKGARVLVFGGGEKEKAVAEAWEKEIKGCSSVIGKASLKEEMALMSNLDCMISMDSSAMHLCSLYGVRVVSVWGATHPYAGFLGYGQKMEDVVSRDLPCRPCSIYGNKACKFGDYRCFDIEPQVIVDRVLGDKMS
ncbi:MAG: glycosyltransferase family 9 protein [Bacteroidales bacterium]|nr:glycosyltransferase family 9 protein [Bacteroidales bacterium]